MARQYRADDCCRSHALLEGSIIGRGSRVAPVPHLCGVYPQLAPTISQSVERSTRFGSLEQQCDRFIQRIGSRDSREFGVREGSCIAVFGAGESRLDVGALQIGCELVQCVSEPFCFGVKTFESADGFIVLADNVEDFLVTILFSHVNRPSPFYRIWLGGPYLQ